MVAAARLKNYSSVKCLSCTMVHVREPANVYHVTRGLGTVRKCLNASHAAMVHEAPRIVIFAGNYIACLLYQDAI